MAQATGDIIPITTLHNLPLGEIVELKAELAARDVTAADGALFHVAVTIASRWTLDAERVKSEMGVGWYDSRCKVGIVTTVRVTARADVAAQSVAQSAQVAA
jgi:hypothetical protein